MKLTDVFQDSLMRTKGQVRTTTVKETARSMKDFIACLVTGMWHGEPMNTTWRDIDVANMTVDPKVRGPSPFGLAGSLVSDRRRRGFFLCAGHGRLREAGGVVVAG